MPQPIHYSLRFLAPSTHYVEVEATIPLAGPEAGELVLTMPVWTPGSYLVRDFSRHVESLTVSGPTGAPLAVEKRRKNRWRIDLAGSGGPVTVRYRLYCRELSVRTNFVDADFALLNGAATFLTVFGEPERPVRVRLEPPPDWPRIVTPLPPVAERTFEARDLDQLVDSPLYLGAGQLHRLAVPGEVPHLLVNEGAGALWDGERSAADAAAIIDTQRRLWGGFPYRGYSFINLIHEGRGGLEHRDSSVLMTGRFATRRRESYLRWLSLVSHELFHAWNGKRLRPRELGPFDYEGEVYTESLWVVEGITSYYDSLMVHRAGLSTRQEYLDALSERLATLARTVGRKVQSLTLSSFDAWIKLYRRDENSVNSGISYYTKGAVVAWLLDAQIRRASTGGHSLDDLLREAYRRYAGERGYSSGEIERLAGELAGSDLTPFFDFALRTTEELDLAPALDWFGLRLTRAEDAAEDEEVERRGWLGLVTERREGRLVVSEVRRETPAHDGGFNAGDELVAVDGYRVTPGSWGERQEVYRPGDRATFLIARRGAMREIAATFGREPIPRWRLTVDPQATADQQRQLADWLAGPADPADPGVAAAPGTSAAAAGEGVTVSAHDGAR